MSDFLLLLRATDSRPTVSPAVVGFPYPTCRTATGGHG